MLELCQGEGVRSLKSAALQGQSSFRNVWRATEYVSQDLTLFPAQMLQSPQCDAFRRFMNVEDAPKIGNETTAARSS